MLNAINASAPATGSRSTVGDRLLQKIAKASREWKQTVGRKVDMESECFDCKRNPSSSHD